MRSLKILMIEIFSPLYFGHNYRRHKGIYFLTINGRPRRKLSHQHRYKFQLFLPIMFMLSLQLSGTACGYLHQPLHGGWRRSGDKAAGVGELRLRSEQTQTRILNSKGG